MIGEIVMYYKDTAIPATLACDGSAVSRTTYAALYAVIGDTYGAGDGSTTFNLPDLRGKFPRGWSNGAAIDPNAGTRTDRGDGTTGDNVGTNQDDGFISHAHNILAYNGSGSLARPRYQGHASPTTRTFGNNGGVGIGSQTRPINTTVLGGIRYA